MGIRCLFGHDFGDPETEHQRDERGDEVVVTIREYKECSRCGRQRTLSENTEVKTTEPEPEPASDSTATPGGMNEDHDTADDGFDTADGPESVEDVTAAEDDGVILDNDDPDDSGRGHGEWPESEPDEPTTESEPESWPDDEAETVEADAVESGAAASDTDRSWPEAPDEPEGGFSATAPSQADEPAASDEPEGTVAESPSDEHSETEATVSGLSPDDDAASGGTEVSTGSDDSISNTDTDTGLGADDVVSGEREIDAPDDDAEFIDADDHDPSSDSGSARASAPTETESTPTGSADQPAESAGGSVEEPAGDPAPPDDIDPSAHPEPDSDPASESTADRPADPGTGIESEGPTPAPTGRHRSTATNTVFVCPSCGYSAAADDSSLRPGDICPECRRGYLAEREPDA